MSNRGYEERPASSGRNVAHDKLSNLTVASLLALLALAQPATAQVTPPSPPCDHTSGGGTIATCAGDLSSGVLLNNGAGPFTTLNVLALTSNITPALGVSGVVFSSDGNVAIDVSASPFRIVTTGDDAIGVIGASLNGSVAISSAADIATTGHEAYGIAAITDAGDIAIASVGSIATAGDGVGPADGAFGIYALSNTGDIAIFSDSDISTTGILGVGIYAETTGAIAISSNGNITTQAEDAPGIAAAGEAGVVVVSTGDIRTFGDSAPGITVMADGDAMVVSSSNITTTGMASDGIAVTSLFGMAMVVSTGDVFATGFGSAGIYAAGDTGAVIINSGSVMGGACCAGVMMDSNGTNTLLNRGTITAGLADYAIDLRAATDNTVENFGTVTGDVRLFDGFAALGTFNNHAGALFNSGSLVMASLVTNEGTIAPGGRGSVQTTALGDDLVQTRGGNLAIDVAGASAASDQIIVSDTARLAGSVTVSVVSLPPLMAVRTYTIVTALGGVTNDGLSLLASPALHASLAFTATDVLLTTSADFTVSGLNRNERVIASSLNSALALGGGGLSPVLEGLLNTYGLDAYVAALNELSPELFSDAQIAALYSGLGFANSLLSCRVNGADTAAIVREGQCLWAGANAVFLDQGTTAQQIGFSETAGLFSAGAQIALDEVWRLGFGAGYQQSWLKTSTGAVSDGEQVQGGVTLKYNSGPLLLAGVFNAGHGWYDTERPIAFGGFAATAASAAEIDILNGGLRAAYVFGSPRLYWKPVLDAAVTSLDLGDFAETGGGAANLLVQGAQQTVYTIAPSLEAGTEWWLANGTLVRPFLRGGAAWYEDGDLALTAGFLNAPVGTAPFTVVSDMDDVMGTVGAGLDMINGGEAALHLGYEGQLGETTQIHAFSLKGSARF